MIRAVTVFVFIAPQAQLEESANDRGKPEVPINWDVKRFGGSVFGPWFGRFQEQLLRRSGPKQEPGTASNPPNSVIFLSCCCLLDTFLYALFLTTSAQLQRQFQEKTRRKKGSRNSYGVEVDRFRRFSSDPGQSLSDPGERARLGRWHSPQVAPAAPPVPETNKNGGVAGTLLS